MRKSLLWFSLIALSCTGSGEKAADSDKDREGSAQMLPSPSRGKAGEPFLSRDPSGNILMSWIEQADSLTHRLVYSRLEDSVWSEPKTISTGANWFVNWADYPQMASDGQGNYIATWLQKSGPGTYAYDIMISHSNGGIEWSNPVKVNEDGKEAEHGFVSIAPWPGKGFLVTWLDGRNTRPMPAGSHDHEGHDGGAMTLRAALLDANGKKLSESELDGRTCDCCQTSVALSDQGPVVVYRDRSEKEVRDIWTTRMLNGQWLAPQPLSNDQWIINGCPVNGPQLAIKKHKAVVAWYTESGKNPGVYAAFSANSGESFGQRVRIHDSIPLGRVDIVLTEKGTAYVSWMESNRIMVRPVMEDGKAGPVIQVARNNSARSAGFPQMTMAGEKLVFAWTDAATKTIQTCTLLPGPPLP